MAGLTTSDFTFSQPNAGDTGFGTEGAGFTSTKGDYSLGTSLSPAEVDKRAESKAELEMDMDTSSESASQFSSAISSAAGEILNGYISNLRAGAENDYKNAANKWRESRKDWFDPSYDTIPSLSEYLKGLPSERDLLTGSTLTGGEVSASTDGATLGVATLGISAAFDDQEQAEYIWNKGGEGAVEGALSGGWVGAIVGGLVGVVEGALGWASAEDADEANIKRATEEYQRKYDQWLDGRKKRQAMAAMAQAEGIEERKLAEQNTKRSAISNTFKYFGQGVIR